MRIQRLLLTRYGHFTGTEIDLTQEHPGLVILLGRNEAGKSTLREAMGDLLFGIPERTSRNFIHSYDTLQIGAHLLSSRGEQLAFQRVKRRGNTLQNPAGNPLPDGALLPFLGGADRELFNNLFGLSQDSLRTGGNRMLAAEGRLGEMIFGAAGGMRDLVTLQKELDEEARSIYTSRKRSALPFYQSLDAWNDARRQVNQLLVGAGEWQELQKELTAAEQEQGHIRDSSRQLTEARNRLERMRRIFPLARDLAQVRAELLQVATAPDLPESTPQRHQQALEQLQRSRERYRERETELSALQKEIDALQINQPLLAHADEIKAIHEGRGAVLKARKDLPGLLGLRQQSGERLEKLARDLKQSWSATEVIQKAPSGMDLEEVQSLIAAWTRLDTEEKRTRERVQEAAADLQRIQGKLANLTEPADPTPLRLVVEKVQAQGDLPGRLQQVEVTVANLERRLQDGLAGLTFWKGDVEQLARIPVPVAATLHRFEKEFTTLTRRMEKAEERLKTASQQRDKAIDALARLHTDATIPTPEAIAEARHMRDRFWQKIQRYLVEGHWLADDPAPAILAEQHVRALLAADHLADRRVVEATRLARHAALQEELAVAQRDLTQAGTELQATRQAFDTLLTQWRQQWNFLAGEPGWPPEMTAWMGQREGLLRHLESLLTARAEATTLHQEMEKSRQALLQALASPSPLRDQSAPLSAILQHARSVLESLQQANATWSALQTEQARCTTLLQRETRRLDDVTERQEKLQASWILAMDNLGLDEGTSAEAAGVALAIWRDIRQEAEKWRDLGERIQAIRQDEVDYAHWVETLASSVFPVSDNESAPDSANKDVLVKAQKLFDTLASDSEQARRKQDLHRRATKTATASQEAATEMAKASTTLQALQEQAGAPTLDELAARIEQAERKRILRHREQELTGRIVSEADGATLEQALAETAGMDPDQIRAEIDQLSQSLEALLSASAQAGERVQELRTRLGELTKGRGAAVANQEVSNAQTLLRQHAQRWMVLRTAAFLLKTGIDHYRQERQGPILARAGHLFRLLTCNRFAGFRAEYDQKETPILFGLRDDHTTCPVAGMSDGTQDQLYLALRLAIIEEYGQLNEPLPFIADDLFVNFDDQRSRAGFDVLLQLARSTQILFLTHHDHLAELAKQQGGEQVAIRQIGSTGQNRDQNT
ncbi:MAG: AAA family ATPase [Magnetococcales bacterium]|nr:AAA family ATPase [Magnetococcales bacterium]